MEQDRELQIRAVFSEAGPDTLVSRMGIKIIEATAERVVGSMPVSGNTQPYGLLHGGASCVLAETLGSLGSAPLIPYYKAGTLLMLAQSTGTRSPSLPDVPTFEEAGIKGLVLDQWVGAFAPAKTPPAITQRLAAEIGKALADPAIRDSFQKAGLDPATRSPQEFREYVGEESKKFERLVSELHIKVN